MNYTIAKTKDLATDQSLTFGKDGQYYTIGLYDNNGNGTTINILNHNKEENIYLEIVSYIIDGYYSFNDRLKILRDYGKNYTGINEVLSDTEN